jgi:hypothetical protein
MKRLILIIIPLIWIAYLLIKSWIVILSEGYVIQWRHITGLLLFLPLPVLLFKNYKVAVLAVGGYLVLGVVNLISLTPDIVWNAFGIGGLRIGDFNLLSLGIFVVYLILNIGALMDMHLDYKESKAKKAGKPIEDDKTF